MHFPIVSTLLIAAIASTAVGQFAKERRGNFAAAAPVVTDGAQVLSTNVTAMGKQGACLEGRDRTKTDFVPVAAPVLLTRQLTTGHFANASSHTTFNVPQTGTTLPSSAGTKRGIIVATNGSQISENADNTYGQPTVVMN